jgi:hypothetical protein
LLEMATAKDRQWQALWDAAEAKGFAAGDEAVPVPMIVGEPTSLFGSDIDFSKKTHFVSEGVCGFAWVKVTPGTSSFARWLVKTGRVRGRAYGGGVDIWVGHYGQSMQRKEAFARAFASVLREAGIKAYAQSRMD